MAKQVDARDLKSLGFGHTGSTPVVRTILCAQHERPNSIRLSCGVTLPLIRREYGKVLLKPS